MNVYLSAQLAEDALGPYLAKVGDRALKHALEYGVAFLHETQPPAEQDAVSLLFKSGAIQVNDRPAVAVAGVPVRCCSSRAPSRWAGLAWQ